MSFIVGQTVGDYSILQELGKGGSGRVYKVEHTITRRREALKILTAGASDPAENWERFLREIRLQASLTHPNIAAVLTAFWVNDEIALVCELLDGESLKDKLERGQLPLSRALALMSEVLSALSYAHAHGVVHRDISPANIFLTAAPESAKLINFGLAKAAADLGLTLDGSSIGTPHYMSPEQARGVHAPDARSDVYSCGAVLFELVTGRKLFQSASTLEIMQAHAMEPPEHAKTLNPSIPEELDAIIAKSLAKEPSARFQSAESLRDAVENVRRKLDVTHAVPAVKKRPPALAWAVGSALVITGLAAGYWTLRGHVEPPKSPGVTDMRPATPAAEPVRPSPLAPAQAPANVKPAPVPQQQLKMEKPIVAVAAPADEPVTEAPPSTEVADAPIPVDNLAISKKPASKVGGVIKRLNPFRKKQSQELAADAPSQSFVSR